MNLSNISSEQELRKIMEDKLRKASVYAVEEIMQLNREAIREIVYDAYTPSFYNRTGDFLEAWQISESTNEGDVGAEMIYDSSNMMAAGREEEDLPIHEDFYGNDVRDYLADIIYEGTAGAVSNRPVNRNAWKALDKMLTKTAFRQIFERAMTKAGIQWKRGQGGLSKEKGK